MMSSSRKLHCRHSWKLRISGKLAYSKESEWSHKDESSYSDIHVLEGDCLLHCTGGASACYCGRTQTYGNFQWKERTSIVFKVLLKLWIHLNNFVTISLLNIIEQTICYSQQFRRSMFNMFSKQSRVNEWWLVTVEAMHIVLALFILIGIILKARLWLY
jgi:hypothetical protein